MPGAQEQFLARENRKYYMDLKENQRCFPAPPDGSAWGPAWAPRRARPLHCLHRGHRVPRRSAKLIDDYGVRRAWLELPEGNLLDWGQQALLRCGLQQWACLCEVSEVEAHLL